MPSRTAKSGGKVQLNKDYCYFHNGYYLKDSNGTVWQIIRTSYKELPVFNLDTKRCLARKKGR